jgi:hypothetical protein
MLASEHAGRRLGMRADNALISGMSARVRNQAPISLICAHQSAVPACTSRRAERVGVPAARVSPRPRTGTARCSVAHVVCRQVNTPPGGVASVWVRRLVNGDAKMELPRFQVKPY